MAKKIDFCFGLLVCSLFLSGNAFADRALLVGVGEYPNLDQGVWLDGPENDMVLVREMLTGHRFEIPDENVHTLVGWPEDETMRPTRANIIKGMEELAITAQPEEWVVIWFSGHGSQQPASNDHSELDGLDEVLLPADISGWDDTIGGIDKAIVDNEIGVLLNKILAKGAFVWYVVDACHSGTGTRGLPDAYERVRELDLMPDGVLPAKAGAKESPVDNLGAERLVAMFAVHQTQKAIETALPDPDSKTAYGLFTYSLVEVLGQAESPLTFKELNDRIMLKYRAGGRYGISPHIDGGAAQNEVLGKTVWPERPSLLVKKMGDSPNQVVVDAGTVIGLNVGTLLAAFPAAGSANADESLGLLKIVESRPFEAVAEPCGEDQLSAVSLDDLSEGLRCTVHRYSASAPVLVLSLAGQKAKDSKILRKAIANLEKGPWGQLVEMGDEGNPGKWGIEIVDDDVILFSGTNYGLASADDARRFLISSLSNQDSEIEIETGLVRLARTERLLALASGNGGMPGSGALEVEIRRFKSETSKDALSLLDGIRGQEVPVNDYVSFHIINNAKVPMDFTLLFIDSNFAIHPIYPGYSGAGYNRLAPGGDFETGRFRVTDTTINEEFLVAIAVKAQGPNQDFVALKNVGLRIRHGATKGLPRNALTELLDGAMNPSTKGLRGLKPPESNSCFLKLLSWNVTKENNHTKEEDHE